MRALAVILLAAVLACAPRAPPPDLSLDPGRLLGQVRDAAGRVVSVRGEARLRARGEGRGSVSAFVAAEKPDRLHLEALDFFGNPVAVLVTAGGRLAIYDARDRTFYRGAATPRNVARLVPLALSPEELVAILCGAPALGGEAVSAEPGRGFVTLQIRDGIRTTVMRVVKGAAVARAEVRDAGARYDLTNADRGEAGVPDAVTLSSKQPRVRIDLSWKDVEVNAALDAGLFRLAPPAGARVVDLDAQGGPPPILHGDPWAPDEAGSAAAAGGGPGASLGTPAPVPLPDGRRAAPSTEHARTPEQD